MITTYLSYFLSSLYQRYPLHSDETQRTTLKPFYMFFWFVIWHEKWSSHRDLQRPWIPSSRNKSRHEKEHFTAPLLSSPQRTSVYCGSLIVSRLQGMIDYCWGKMVEILSSLISSFSGNFSSWVRSMVFKRFPMWHSSSLCNAFYDATLVTRMSH